MATSESQWDMEPRLVVARGRLTLPLIGAISAIRDIITDVGQVDAGAVIAHPAH